MSEEQSECIINKDFIETTDGWNASPYTFIQFPEKSPWRCHLFGSDGSGITWVPDIGKEPNWFWRKMQFLCFGNRWVKDESTGKTN